MAAASETRPRGMQIASVSGVPVYIGSSWLILAAVIVALIGPGVAADRPDLGVLAYGVGLLYALGLLVAVLVHEAAHAVVARAFGHEVHAVVADLWGGHTTYDPARGTPGSAAAIAVVGPVSNAILGAIAIVAHPVAPEGVPSGLVGAFAFVNLALAVFNLLPGLPLDGGQLVESLVWQVTGSRPRGRVVAGWLGRVMAVVLLLVLVGIPFAMGAEPSLFRIVWSVLIAGFLWQGASAAIGAGSTLAVLGAVDPSQVIRPVVPVRDIDPVTVLDRLGPSDVPVVVDGQGRPVAMLSAGALDAVPTDLRERTPVAAVMARQPPTWVVELSGHDDVVDLVRAFHTAEVSLLAVMRDGRLAGVISSTDLNRALEAADDRRRR